MLEQVSFGRRLSDVATAHPDRVAVVFYPRGGEAREITFGEMDARANRIARRLAEEGVGPGSLVCTVLPDEPLAIQCWFAAWKLGAGVLPLSHRLPARELASLLDTAAQLGEGRRITTIGRFTDGPGPDVDAALLDDIKGYEADPLPDVTPPVAFAIGSGGTSGQPKITLNDGPAALPIEDGEVVLSGLLDVVGVRSGQVHLVCTPTYHTNGFATSYLSLLMGDTVVLFEKFDAPRIVEAIERHRVNQFVVVPVVLQRLAQVDGIQDRDLSSLVSVTYGGAPCPDWVARAWIDLIGPKHLFHGYGATEGVGKTVLRGDEWLERPGSCGRPVGSEVKILDEDRQEVPVGEVGELFMRPEGAEAPAFEYAGADYKGITDDGFVSLGDFAKVDEDGFVYIVDRRADLIISGGANVYPAEVENALSEHPDVVDVAVIGLPDQDWGRRVHAIVEARDGAAGADEAALDAWCRERLAPYKCPKTYEYVQTLPRTPVGKISRARLLEERVTATEPDVTDVDAQPLAQGAAP